MLATIVMHLLWWWYDVIKCKDRLKDVPRLTLHCKSVELGESEGFCNKYK